jgi:hypothetical protein
MMGGVFRKGPRQISLRGDTQQDGLSTRRLEGRDARYAMRE